MSMVVRRKINRTSWGVLIRESLGLLLGAVLMAVGMNMFMVPNMLAPGGISGLGVVFFHVLGIPVGLTIVVLNIPLFIVGYLTLGPRVLLHTVMATFLFSAAVELTAPYMPSATDDLLLAAVYGGIIIGIGVGLIFRCRGSTGGTALLSLILARTSGISPGQALLWGDLSVLGLAIFIFGSEAAMYAALSLFVSSKVIDTVLEGPGMAKTALVITCCGEEMNKRLLHGLGRGVTRLEGAGGFTGLQREVLLCVITRPQVQRLREIVWEVDAGAFVVIGNATEVHGEGFRPMQETH